jgi:glycosyltransferase involved in cell wall biosynthesis
MTGYELVEHLLKKDCKHPMKDRTDKVRVLYSFPHRLGADRICYTAWEQVNGLASAGADILVHSGSISRAVPKGVRTNSTLARGNLRIPYRVLGSMRALKLHDWIVSRRLERIADQIDIVHAWPLGALSTLKAAARLGIPTVLERPNAHTRFAYEVVKEECERIGVPLPRGHEHAFNAEILEREEEEYRTAYRLLCPSEFTLKTFVDQGFSREQLARHFYGVDEKVFHPNGTVRQNDAGLTVIFVGVAAVRKGLHLALEAWLQSPAHKNGTFLIAGEMLPDYAAKLGSMLSHPSVHPLGHRTDVPDLMRKSDAMILPTIEEGFGLVCTEAMSSGCVPIVSEACTEICKHMVNSLVHRIGDVSTLTQHITLLYENRLLLQQLRATGLKRVPEITWDAAGERLLEVYRETIDAKRASHTPTRQ